MSLWINTGRLLAAAAITLATAPALLAQGAPATGDGHIQASSELRGRKILLIAGEPEKDHPTDDLAIKKHLEQQGYVVTMGKEETEPAQAAGQDLIMISSTADGRETADKFAESTIPVFTWNTISYPDMKMTGPERHVDFETIDPVQDYARAFTMLYGYIPNVMQPIARDAGIQHTQMFGTNYLLPQAFGWGKPGPAASIVVNVEGDSTHAGVFTYEKGSTMMGSFVAPARRVGYYLQDATFHNLTAVHGEAENDPQLAAWWVGQKLFDATVRWALSAPPAPQVYDPAALKTRLSGISKGRKLLFVRRMNTPEGEESDDHMSAHFKDLGFIVTEADQAQPDSMADGQDVVVISATTSKYKMANKYRDVKVPLLLLEGLSADIYKMANRHRYVDYGEHGEAKESEDPPEQYLEIVNASSVMAAGLKPGYVKYIKEPDVIKWATPLPSAITIAILPNSARERAIFGYEKGSAMADEYIAPARRALLPVDNPAFDDLTEQGHALFDATLLWVVSPPAR